jgi:hypothetical protein
MTMEFREADLADVAASTVEELRPEARRKNIHLSLSATSVPNFPLDPTAWRSSSATWSPTP